MKSVYLLRSIALVLKKPNDNKNDVDWSNNDNDMSNGKDNDKSTICKADNFELPWLLTQSLWKIAMLFL